jgi:hypothetical protein
MCVCNFRRKRTASGPKKRLNAVPSRLLASKLSK